MANSPPAIDPADELVCLGHDEDLTAQGGALAPPIVQTSLFAHRSLGDLAGALVSEHDHMVYSRGNNPTVAAVEAKLARLERGAACRCLASGMAAISAVLLSQLRAGDHVLFVNQVYGPTLQLARRLERFGIGHDVVLDLEIAAVEAALRPQTRILWMESPGTMLFRQLDVAAAAAAARSRGVLAVMDNSWATPLFQKPLTLGVDLVVHSATKYLGGHSDLLAGAVVGGAEIMERLFYDAQLLLGGVLGPHDAWLLNRGLRTLPVRMRQHHHDALELARRLASHPRVRRVFHPGLVGGRRAASLGGYSGLFSFELDAESYEAVARCVDRLRLFRIGVSWGGVESLVIAAARGDGDERLAAAGIPRGLVRLSVGLEGVEALWSDLERALAEP
jgi:cystathionine beta-lyase/cystathionine gamma-synthase